MLYGVVLFLLSDQLFASTFIVENHNTCNFIIIPLPFIHKLFLWAIFFFGLSYLYSTSYFQTISTYLLEEKRKNFGNNI